MSESGIQPTNKDTEVEVLLEDTPGQKETEGLLLKDPDEEGNDYERAYSNGDGAAVYDWLKDHYKYARLPNGFRLITEENVLRNSILAVRFSAMCSAINTKMLNPNYPIMVQPGAHPDSFPNTDPFGFNAATYFLPLCSLLGVALASVSIGKISDKVGRKKVMVALAWISAVGSVVKYFTKETFWGFCITQIVFGFFLGNIPVAMAYVGDVYQTKAEKENELGILISFFVIGSSGGGIIAILMNSAGLFAPLWVGAGLLVISALITSWYMVDAGDLPAAVGKFTTADDDDEDKVMRPTTIEHKALWNIIIGAVADNFGSTGLVPLCLSPLAIEQYLFQFTEADPPQEPVMTIVGYQWLSVMVAAMVIPSTMMTPYTFRKFGVAGTCVMGNLMTALVTLGLLLIGNGPATRGWFGAFVAVLYAGFPFTVFSQLTTGPMLDTIAPIDKIGYVQGLNNAAMNFGMAIAPWLFGVLADATTTNTAIITGIGVSCLAAAINAPLACDSRFGRQKELPPASKRALAGEDPDFVERALAGDLVDQEALVQMNFVRMKAGQSTIIPRVKPYSEDKANGLRDLHSNAENIFLQRMLTSDRVLVALYDQNPEKSPEELCKMLNASLEGDEDIKNEAVGDLGKWIGDYLQDAGYNPHTNSAVIKQMILTAMPAITFDKEFTPENLKLALLRARHVFGRYAQSSRKVQEKDWTYSDTFGKGSMVAFYS